MPCGHIVEVFGEQTIRHVWLLRHLMLKMPSLDLHQFTCIFLLVQHRVCCHLTDAHKLPCPNDPQLVTTEWSGPSHPKSQPWWTKYLAVSWRLSCQRDQCREDGPAVQITWVLGSDLLMTVMTSLQEHSAASWCCLFYWVMSSTNSVLCEHLDHCTLWQWCWSHQRRWCWGWLHRLCERYICPKSWSNRGPILGVSGPSASQLGSGHTLRWGRDIRWADLPSQQHMRTWLHGRCSRRKRSWCWWDASEIGPCTPYMLRILTPLIAQEFRPASMGTWQASWPAWS